MNAASSVFCVVIRSRPSSPILPCNRSSGGQWLIPLAAGRKQCHGGTVHICIGYGFADVHINDIIRRWLEFTGDRRIEIVGPYVPAVPSFLVHLSPQVSLHDMRATDFLERFALTGVRHGQLRHPAEVIEPQPECYT
jgi:hypothetical protein